MIPIDGSRKVATPGVRVRLVSVPTPLIRIDIEASHENLGNIFIGGPDVSAVTSDLRGRRLEPGDTVSFDQIDLSDWWIDAELANEYVHWGGEQIA